nr:HAD family hydrolase [uncultured Lichenicoccus sp.]
MTLQSNPVVIVFDVNETLLDMAVLEPLFLRLFREARAMHEWFAQLGAGTLRMMGQTRGVAVEEFDINELRTRMRDMLPHPDVVPALQRLRDAGFRPVTLSNSAPDPQGGPLQRTGLDSYFERTFSVDSERRFKPAPETYAHVAGALGVSPGEMCLVAAHTWDTLGAQAAGCMAALVTRPGNAVLPVQGVPQPDTAAVDLSGVADMLLERRPQL